MKLIYSALLALVTASSVQASDIVITGVIDGPLTGGVPKGVELFVLNDISDLSVCGVGFANNGGGTDGEEFTFPEVSATAGSYIYVASESAQFSTFFGFSPDYTSGSAGINGDDAIELFCNDSVVDVFGDIDTDGSGQPWEYTDGWAYRDANTGPNGSTFTLSEWSFSSPNALDGESGNSSASLPFPLKSFAEEIDNGTIDNTNDSTNVETEDPTEGGCVNCEPVTKVADAVSFDANTYYADVQTQIDNEAAIEDIKAVLSQTITNNAVVLTYSQVWSALTFTDEDPNDSDNITLWYTGTSRAKNLNGGGSGDWNREHSWPSSHGFGGDNLGFTAYTDIHHLRPADVRVNSTRGNLDFDNSDNELSNAQGNFVDGDSFEPRDEIKGDVARMMFYVDTRYEDLIEFNATDNTPDLVLVDSFTTTASNNLGLLCRLWEWHLEDPVDFDEISRNEKIYEYQGNRNPFIDNPDWAEMFYLTPACATDDIDNTDNGSVDSVNETPTSSGLVFINEIHYDNAGADINEGVEVAGVAGTNLTGMTLVAYNGNGGGAYTTVGLSGVLADQNSGFGTLFFTFSNLQNGAPDGIALIDVDGTVIEFLSYEGAFTATDGAASGLTSVDIGVEETSSTSVGFSLQLVGTGDESSEFTWQAPATDSFGAVNEGQSFGSGSSIPGDDIDQVIDVVEFGACFDDATLISAIQGDSDASPLVGNTVVLEAIVSATVADLDGFFVQEQIIDQDDNRLTSEGIFIFYNGDLPVEGSVVRIVGEVSEFFGRTQITPTETPLLCGTGSVTAATLTLPFSSVEETEALEGMLVTSAQELFVSDNFSLGRFGEVSLSSKRLFTPTNVFIPGSDEAFELEVSNELDQITLDDGVNGQNPENVIFPTGGLSASNTLRSGDTVSSLTGVVDFSFSLYRVIPTTEPTFVSSNERTDAPELNLGNLTVASLNVLNYFVTLDEGDDICGPNASLGCRGANDSVEFERQRAKTVSAIVAMNADIVGLMEIENNGYDENSAIASLVNGINDIMGEGTYDYVNAGSPAGTDAITVALIYKPAVVSTIGDVAILDSDNSIVDEDGVLFVDTLNRPSFVQKFALNENNEEIVVNVNHLKSKGSGCGAGDDDTTTGQGNCNLTRARAAEALTSFLATEFPEDPILIIGDLNSYAKEDPIVEIESAGFTNLVNYFGGDQAYSFTFDGLLGYLDHALANNQAFAKIVDVTEWHINADEPIILDYNLEFKSESQQETFFAADSFRMSDHDPVLIALQLDAPVEESAANVDVNSDGSVNFNDYFAIFAVLNTTQSDDSFNATADFNGDGVISTTDLQLWYQLFLSQ